MTQNTEQNVRTREYGEAKSLKIQRELRLSSHDLPALARHARQCFEEGAEEQRRKDGEGQEPRAYEHVMTYETDETNERLSYSPENAFGKPGKDYSAEYPVVITPLYTRPANVPALEARIAELVEAEQLARADAEASKAQGERLREALTAVSENKTDDCPGSFDRPYIHKLGWAVEWCRRKARAALTREGGV